MLGAATILAVRTAAPWWVLAIGIIGPDLTFLTAAGQQPPAPGLMPQRAVPFYNAAHHPTLPAAAIAVAIAVGSPTGTVLAITWLSHIIWDRGVGYTRRDAGGRQLPSRW